MWKDFFYFSKGQRIGVIVLLVLIFISMIINHFAPLFFNYSVDKDTSFVKEATAFKDSLVSVDSLRKHEWERRFAERQLMYKKNSYYKPIVFNNYSTENIRLSDFDPNTIDSVSLIRLGLKPYVASNILKYRKKGGKFRCVSDFSKVYGISKEKMSELLKYIKIVPPVAKDSSGLVLTNSKIILPIELNSADTSALMKLKGVNRFVANSIIRFRNALGGFYSIDQLKETKGLSQEIFEKIKPMCVVNSSSLFKIRVNFSSVQRLNAHPYINFYQAKAIYEFRREKGKIKNINDLKILTELSPSDLERLLPYFSFD